MKAIVYLTTVLCSASAVLATAGGMRRAQVMREMLAKAEPYYENDFERDVVANQNRKLDEDIDDDYYGFDMTEFSLKYTRCQVIKTFSEEAAANNYQNVMVSENLVIFRLCPANTCSANRRSGCSSNFGQYILPLEDYLYYMTEYKEAKEKHYCQWCQKCIANQNRRKLDAAADEDEEVADEEDEYEEVADEEDEYEGEGEDEYEDEEEEEEVVECPSDCDNYYSVCQNDNNNAIEYEDYIECQKFRTYDANGGKLNLYVGPYCNSDSSTITIDVFYDQMCTVYAGNEHDVIQVTGVSLQSNGLQDYTPHECIPCKESSLPYQNSEADENDENNISEVCVSLFEESGKCNSMMSTNGEETYASLVQFDNEKTTCTFIDNIVSGSYTQEGEVVLNQKAYNARNGYFTKVDFNMPAWQVVCLVFFIFGTVILAVIAFYLEPLVKVPVPGNKHLIHGPSHGQYGHMT
eukprot:CAMPEP_0116067928 /NCGR_PEP_ID=MMETSP0322-20121206/11360_1 /TAXON_ID=163516 /ORGANISM="Leptocylindrus danicus var. apora, Strain B651" /LENGTH=463 /DNA_ID=CAMNT_0003554947 /DNA_START=15 /DNA_END=1406 /DNA_ORIENTATION=+